MHASFLRFSGAEKATKKLISSTFPYILKKSNIKDKNILEKLIKNLQEKKFENILNWKVEILSLFNNLKLEFSQNIYYLNLVLYFEKKIQKVLNILNENELTHFNNKISKLMLKYTDLMMKQPKSILNRINLSNLILNLKSKTNNFYLNSKSKPEEEIFVKISPKKFEKEIEISEPNTLDLIEILDSKIFDSDSTSELDDFDFINDSQKNIPIGNQKIISNFNEIHTFNTSNENFTISNNNIFISNIPIKKKILFDKIAPLTSSSSELESSDESFEKNIKISIKKMKKNKL